MFIAVYILNFLFEAGGKRTFKIEGESFALFKVLFLVGGFLLAAAFYINEKRTRVILFWVAGTIILLSSLYYILFLRAYSFSIICGSLFGILILICGSTGKIDRVLERMKRKKSESERA